MSASRKFLCVLLAPHDVKRRNMFTIVMLTGGKKAFFPLPCPPLDWVTVGHSVTFVNIPHTLVIALYNVWLQSVSISVTKVAFYCWWIVHICQHIDVTCIYSDHCRQVMSCPGLNITTFRSFVLY
jgi:hypothetical protein